MREIYSADLVMNSFSNWIVRLHVGNKITRYKLLS